MLSHAFDTATSAGRDESGFTLIEVLVALVAATVVAGALFAILNFSSAQTANLTDRVQADQLGSQAMTSIVDELHSACLAPAFVPIQETSNEHELIFINSNSKEAEIGSTSKATEVHKHKIKWESASGTLVDYSYSATSGTVPSNFVFSEAEGTLTKTLLASHVSQTGSTPIFQYFSYATASNQSESTPDSTLNTTALAVPLSGTTAKEASSVLINFSTAPTNAATTIGPTATDRTIAQTDQVTFAFSIPNPETPIHDSPCQ
jgi:prepilin-type N-terminal cleavage/methylation domain-containing protein